MTYEDARGLVEAGAVALLPTGATEAHGPHLPLATDVVISRTGAERAVQMLRRDGVPSVVLPPLAYAVTEFAAECHGTIGSTLETATGLVEDVLGGAARAGFGAVVICNAHLEPGNIQALTEGMNRAAVEREGWPPVRAAFPDVTRKPHALRLGEEFKSGACHAGRYETSLVMAAGPFLVKRDLSDALEPNPNSLSVAIRAGKKTFGEAGGPHAYFGWPADATEAEGHALYQELGDIFATAAKSLLG